MKDAQYWKEYRIKNGEKLRAYKRARYVKRNGHKVTTLPLEASKPTSSVIVADGIPKPRKCQSSYCNNVGSEVLVAGMKAWLCVDHRPKA